MPFRGRWRAANKRGIVRLLARHDGAGLIRREPYPTYLPGRRCLRSSRRSAKRRALTIRDRDVFMGGRALPAGRLFLRCFRVDR